ncbi:MAG: hypothetical protein ACI9JN_001535 [Bacteroidia bacterium]|jgi:hypothetical protein
MNLITKLGLLLCFTTLSFFSQAQGVEVNPSLQWKFVISQDLTFQSGNFVIYEFPAEKNFDYIFNITHNQDSLHAVIMIYDMQDAPLGKMILDNNQLSIDLPFDVSQSGTYKVVLGLTDPKGSKGTPIESTLTLLKRPSI